MSIDKGIILLRSKGIEILTTIVVQIFYKITFYIIMIICLNWDIINQKDLCQGNVGFI